MKDNETKLNEGLNMETRDKLCEIEIMLYKVRTLLYCLYDNHLDFIVPTALEILTDCKTNYDALPNSAKQALTWIDSHTTTYNNIDIAIDYLERCEQGVEDMEKLLLAK